MGTKNNPCDFDCYANALPDEPMFVLLARDIFAPEIVEKWAESRMRSIVLGLRPMSDLPMIDEAQRCAAAMREWRKVNWPSSPQASFSETAPTEEVKP